MLTIPIGEMRGFTVRRHSLGSLLPFKGTRQKNSWVSSGSGRRVFLTWNARLRYNLRIEHASPLETIRSARAPVLLIQGTGDWLIPVQYARHLHEANLQYTELWEVPGAGHALISNVAPEYQQRVLDWFTHE